MKTDIQHKYIECDCEHPMHNFRMSYFPDDWAKEDEMDKVVYVGVILNDKPFWTRVWYAFKYIFKIAPSNYYYGDIIWSKDKIKEIREFLDKVENVN